MEIRNREEKHYMGMHVLYNGPNPAPEGAITLPGPGTTTMAEFNDDLTWMTFYAGKTEETFSYKEMLESEADFTVRIWFIHVKGTTGGLYRDGQTGKQFVDTKYRYGTKFFKGTFKELGEHEYELFNDGWKVIGSKEYKK